MSITRVLLSTVAASLCFSSLACGQSVTDSSSTVSAQEAPQATVSSTATTNSESSADGPAQMDKAQADSTQTESDSNAVQTQVYAGQAKPAADQTQQGNPPLVQASQLQSDDGCTNLFAYDPNDTFVNVRDRPNGEIIASLPNFSRLQLANDSLEPSQGWNEIYSGHRTRGYVYSDLISRTVLSVLDPNDSGANLRSSPNGPIIKKLPNGTPVKFAGTDGNWTIVETEDERIGRISTALLAPPTCS